MNEYRVTVITTIQAESEAEAMLKISAALMKSPIEFVDWEFAECELETDEEAL